MIVLVGAAVGGTLWWLLSDPALTAPGPGSPGSAGAGTARGEILRTALAAGAGVGAAVTLMLAFRRQRQQEIAAAHATHDATERRVTELYTKAVEQLGSDKAAVRLGGLYALERLAQDNPGHRQTIVNVICAYLRMPYTPPDPVPAPDPGRDRREALRAARRRYQAARAGAPLSADPAPQRESGDREGELQVRLTAQRILTAHLRDDRPAGQRSTLPAALSFWEGMSLDLTGATLIDFYLTGGHVTEAVFIGATFTGVTTFAYTTFTRDATFREATFTGITTFAEATFAGNATFAGATFTEGALFVEVTFIGHTTFRGATFAGNAWFIEATFTEGASFLEATFTGETWFDEATFAGNATFAEVTFVGDATFREATFTRHATFRGATFTRHATFAGATFTEGARLGGAVAVDPAADHAWPEGWRLETTPEGAGRLVREETDGDPALWA
ncbi:pentapeptide repeat-containing protein [Streptosporangium pseudovulgare]|uniref:pentapeptide repeat-containing protein n=1 Tax=Streptosporangium pseudovulgare TaxID=35765 RepID=UPI00167066B2|nr:pentapeptide repeat-containing protein [Streptosporangium pseudovulgare]